MKPSFSTYPGNNNPQKKIVPQQAEVLQAFAKATHSTNTKQQNDAWQSLKKWVQKRLYPWLTQYSPIADELAQEGLITLWLTLKNNPLQSDSNPATYLAYYWQMVSAIEQKARTISQKEIRHWHKQAHFNTNNNDESSAQAWEEQVYFHSQQLQSAPALKALDAEIGDIAQCITHLFNQLKKRASLGEKAIWFLKKRFHLDDVPSLPASATIEDSSFQRTIAQELGISQQAVSHYEKRLLKQCKRWLMPYCPF
jgi:DNA-directed RNA polymerase specialized sigma24 family protein